MLINPWGATACHSCCLRPSCHCMQEARHAESLKQQPTQEALLTQQNTLDQLASIHERAQQLLNQNEQAAQREQLPHQGLVVDVAGMGRMKALGETRVAALRESILRAGLEQTLIWGRLKELGWDCMRVHQTTLIGIKSTIEVCLATPFTTMCTMVPT